jgi:alkylated DNA repair dioxygenase AlkB
LIRVIASPQLGLFDVSNQLPEGMRYARGIITPEHERELTRFIETLPLKRFEFAGGFLGNRRVLSFGWRYDYTAQKLTEVSPIPPELLDLRARAATFSRRDAASFAQALVTEYAPGAGIGWHKDKAMFGDIVGVSLLATCKFRLRRKQGVRWLRASVEAAPRSAYLLSGPSRTVWEHSIPQLDQLRYSVTFRTFAH